MDFFTPVGLPSGLPPLVQADNLLLMGTCFATNMGSLLVDAKFPPDINPFGVLYNPLSISAALREVVAGKVYKEEDLFFFRECWHSPMHHGDFSSPLMEETLQRINARLLAARMHSSTGLSDVDFWYILGVRTEDYGACGCKLPQATGICLYSSPTQCAGDCIRLYFPFLRSDCPEPEAESDSYR